MTAGPYDTFDVDVAGGRLRVGRWSGPAGAPLVLALHGITASHRSWSLVADALDGSVTLVAPDLRGRGASSALPCPYGMAVHADDAVAVLDAVGADRPVVVGHSMGGFVATVLGVRHPDRVARLVLVDGGLGVEPPAGISVDDLLTVVIGPAMARLDMTFPTRHAYRDFWRAHPALAVAWSPAIEDYVDYDLTGDEPELRSRVSVAAVRGDAADTIADDAARRAITKLSVPATLVRAERGMFDEPAPLFSDELVAAVRVDAPMLVDDIVVAGTNHYTITMSTSGAAAVARAINDAVANAVAG